MYTDFTNLNKACPKDYYSLSCLGRLVDGSTGYEVFDFLDASRGYHQILLHEADQEKNHVHHRIWVVLLEGDAIWSQECRSYLPENGE
ncbi:hypothetical protein LIER_14748 [Lithospermum erythrorhizon]|uniref:Uncharacterized protein n=1 Tax=Lithospermum erythrorhizon TaxID=34254 RepID=A0AAV3Q1T6_LITER